MATTLTYNYPDKDDAVALNWTTTDIGADHYKIYRRILETDAASNKIQDQKTTSYLDNSVLVTKNMKVPQISIDLQREFGKLKISFVNNPDNIRNYVYSVYTYDVNDNLLSASNQVQIYIKKVPDKYFYLIKKADMPLNKQDKFTETTVNFAEFTNMDNGKYVIYLYAQLGDIKTEIVSARFVIDNTIFKKEEHLDVPNAVRYNNRYRGPHESKKKDFAIMEIKNNINKLKKRVSYLESYKKDFLDKPETINVELTSLLETIESSMEDIRKELKYEKRNN
ncbi:hypothetical protein [Clostridium saccharoperbutylacetonicum]